jgi:hypothetical protein
MVSQKRIALRKEDEVMKKQEAESAFSWLRRNSKEIYDSGIQFISASLIDEKHGRLEVVGEGDLQFYLVAIVNQIKAVKLDKDVDTDTLFAMLRDMYDAIT